MKKLSLIIICLMAYSCTNRSTIVTLEIINAGKGEFYALLPIDGLSSIIALDTLRFSGDTVIDIPIKTKDGMVAFSTYGKKLKNIQTVCGDNDFKIIYNPLDSLNPISFKGKNAEGRALLQQLSLERDQYKYEWVRNFSQFPIDTIATKMANNFEKLASDDISKFDSLLKVGSIDQQFYDYVKLETNVYYALSMGKIIRSNWIAKGDPKTMYEGYAECWDNLFTKFPVTTATYRTNYHSDYADLYIQNYIPFCDSKVTAKLPQGYNSFKEYCDGTISKADSTLKDVVLKKLYVGSFLSSTALNNKSRDTAIVAYLDDFIATYPDSRLNDYFNRHKQELNLYYEKIKSADMSRVHFIENSDQITTLVDLFSKFKGRPLFVDFWFSTCGACLEESAASGDLKKFLAEKGIDILYVSIDQQKREDAWINAIKYNELYGNHIRTSQALHEDIYNVHKIYLYPTYMIVDVNGKIVVPRANYPSTGQKLLDQLTETLDLK